MNISLFKLLYLTFFCIFVLFDYLVRTNVFGEKFKVYYLKFINSNILFVSFTFFVIIYGLFHVTGAFDLLPSMITDINSIFCNMVDSNIISEGSGDGSGDSVNNTKLVSDNASTENKGVNVTTEIQPAVNNNVDNNQIIIQSPAITVTVSDAAANKIVAALSSSGGAVAAVKALTHIQGPPTVKVLVGLGTMATVQGATYGMSKLLESNNNKTDSSSKLVSQHLVDSTNTDVSYLYPNYPLNLLYDINTLINSELIMIVILINLFVAQYILTQDYTKYIPNNKFGKLVNFFLSRYIKIYSQSSKLIVGLCVLNLIVCIFFSKLFLYFIMNPA